MAVIKHTEFKVICDGCACDLTDYVAGRTQTEALREMSKIYGERFHRGKMYCDDCNEQEVRPSLKWVRGNPFKGAKSMDVIELMKKYESEK